MNVLTRACLLILTLAAAGCKKDNNVLDTGVQPDADLLSVGSATMQAYTYSVLNDSVYSFNDRYKFLGINKDAVFGTTSVGLYLNAHLDRFFTVAATDSLVSAEMKFAVDRLESTGDESAVMNFSVFALQSSLSNEKNYFTSSQSLHQKQHLPAVHTGSITVAGQEAFLKFSIDRAYAAEMLAYINGTSNEVFLEKFKGFYILASHADAKEGVIARCDLDAVSSGLFLHYKKAGGDIDTMRLPFSGALAARYNTVIYDPATADASLKLQLSGDTAAGAAKTFVKGPGTVYTRLLLPDLKPLADTVNYVVNRAEIILPVDPGYGNSPGHPLPGSLALMAVTGTGGDELTFDQTTSVDRARYDGKYDAASHSYVINIARHVQGILNGEISNHGFNVVVADPSQADRMSVNGKIELVLRRDIYNQGVVLQGRSGSATPRLLLSYSRIPAR